MWGSMVAFQNRNRYTYIYSSSARSPCERAMTSSEARRQIEITGPHRRPLTNPRVRTDGPFRSRSPNCNGRHAAVAVIVAAAVVVLYTNILLNRFILPGLASSFFSCTKVRRYASMPCVSRGALLLSTLPVRVYRNS